MQTDANKTPTFYEVCKSKLYPLNYKTTGKSTSNHCCHMKTNCRSHCHLGLGLGLDLTQHSLPVVNLGQSIFHLHLVYILNSSSVLSNTDRIQTIVSSLSYTND